MFRAPHPPSPPSGVTFYEAAAGGTPSHAAYARLLAQAAAGARVLASLGLARGDYVVLQLPQLWLHFVWFWAAVLRLRCCRRRWLRRQRIARHGAHKRWRCLVAVAWSARIDGRRQ